MADVAQPGDVSIPENLKSKHEPNEVAYGAGSPAVNLHPGAPKREQGTGKVNGESSTAFSPHEPTAKETAFAKQAPGQES